MEERKYGGRTAGGDGGESVKEGIDEWNGKRWGGRTAGGDGGESVKEGIDEWNGKRWGGRTAGGDGGESVINEWNGKRWGGRTEGGDGGEPVKEAGVHNAKAEECTTPRTGSRNIEIKIGGGGLPRNQK